MTLADLQAEANRLGTAQNIMTPLGLVRAGNGQWGSSPTLYFNSPDAVAAFNGGKIAVGGASGDFIKNTLLSFLTNYYTPQVIANTPTPSSGTQFEADRSGTPDTTATNFDPFSTSGAAALSAQTGQAIVPQGTPAPQPSGYIPPSGATGGTTGGVMTTDPDIQKLLSNISLAQSGNYGRTPNGIVDLRTGQLVNTSGFSGGASGSTGTPAVPNAPATGSSGSQANPTVDDTELNKILASSGLSSDEQTALRALFHTIAGNDAEEMKKLTAQLALGAQYADPVFKQAVRLVQDNLTQSLLNLENDKAFQEKQKTDALERLKQDVATSKDYLSFQERQQLDEFAKRQTADTEALREELASTGFTNSSRRVQKEQLLTDAYGNLVQGTTRAFVEKTNALDTQQNRAVSDTAAELARLAEVTRAGELDKLRAAESTLGSSNLPTLSPNLSYLSPLGGITGSLEKQRYNDIAQFIF